jgi:PadR family transcriptional regulator, regulatory protein PadR
MKEHNDYTDHTRDLQKQDHTPEPRHHPEGEGHSPQYGHERHHGEEHHGHGMPDDFGEHGHAERNFWHEWRSERHHHGPEMDFPIGQALSPKEMEAWREFFHQTFGNWPEDHWIFGGRRFSPWHQGMDTFNPFVATLLSKGGGLLPLYVLHLIAQQPRYGNEIMDMLAEHTNGQWVSNPGAIYPLLTLLEREGFIEGKWEDPEKRTVRIYTVTPTGQAEVARIKMIVTPKIDETIQVLQDFLNELQERPAQGESKNAPANTEAPLENAANGISADGEEGRPL